MGIRHAVLMWRRAASPRAWVWLPSRFFLCRRPAGRSSRYPIPARNGVDHDPQHRRHRDCCSVRIIIRSIGAKFARGCIHEGAREVETVDLPYVGKRDRRHRGPYRPLHHRTLTQQPTSQQTKACPRQLRRDECSTRRPPPTKVSSFLVRSSSPSSSGRAISRLLLARHRLDPPANVSIGDVRQISQNSGGIVAAYVHALARR